MIEKFETVLGKVTSNILNPVNSLSIQNFTKLWKIIANQTFARRTNSGLWFFSAKNSLRLFHFMIYKRKKRYLTLRLD
jgi:hypothetical protein